MIVRNDTTIASMEKEDVQAWQAFNARLKRQEGFDYKKQCDHSTKLHNKLTMRL